MYKKISFFLKNHKEIAIILSIALLLRLAYFLIILHNFGDAGFYLTSNGDAVEYMGMAKQWLTYHTFQNFRGIDLPEITRMPGLPLFIAFFYKIIPGAALAILAQNLIFIFCAAFFYKFVLSLFNKKIAIIAAAILALEPAIIYWNNQLITETLFACLVFLSIYCAVYFSQKKLLSYSGLSGLILALAIFVRPAGEYLAAIFLIFYLLLFFAQTISFKKLFLAVLIFLIGFMIPLLPWMVRNKYVFGSYAISDSSINGFGKYLATMSASLNRPMDLVPSANPLKAASIVRKETTSLITKHPFVFLKIYISSLVPFFFGDAYLSAVGRIFPEIEKDRVITNWAGKTNEFFGFLKGHRGAEALIFFSGKAVWGIISFLSVIGLVFWGFRYKKNIPVLILILLAIIYFSLASGVGSYSRFRFPVNPYIFILCAIGINGIIDAVKVRIGEK